MRGNLASTMTHASGPYRGYDVTIAADPNDITFTTTSDGNCYTNLLFRAYLYTPDGKLINSSNRVGEEHLTPALYTRALHTGLFFQQEISVPLKGNFYLRIGVHDVASDHDGAVEFPVSSIRDLPPIVVSPVTIPLTRRQ